MKLIQLQVIIVTVFNLDHCFVDNEDSSSDTPLLVKEGQLKKCKMGGKISNVQWKKYNFSVFNESIHYSKKYDSQVNVVLPSAISGIIASHVLISRKF